jgi:hypothetical protein
MSISMSPRLTITTFMQGVAPFLKQIADRDEQFFLGQAKTNEALQCFNLGDKWSQLTDEDKDHLWRNVRKMAALGGKILAE